MLSFFELFKFNEKIQENFLILAPAATLKIEIKPTTIHVNISQLIQLFKKLFNISIKI